MADDCCPMKLAVGLGVADVDEPDAGLLPLTPPDALTSELGPLPLAQCGAIGLSSVEADAVAPAAPPPLGVTT